MRYVLGIDTSCYTTSIAVMDEKGQLVADIRKVLDVKTGSRGLSQSEMVFQHMRNFPGMYEQAIAMLETKFYLKAIAVSSTPRQLPNSYMPAFLVGDGYAKTIAATLATKLYRISHQENHIFAGMWSSNGPVSNEFLAIHASGGTTEIVKVSRTNSVETSVELLGGSIDIQAGQLVDRIGVAMGLPFPAGPRLELLAQTARTAKVDIPVAVNDLSVSFTGPENFLLQMLANGAKHSVVAAAVEECIAKSLAQIIVHAVKITGVHDILAVGGVTANQHIRNRLRQETNKVKDIRFYYPDSRFSSDNAVGNAYYALIH